MRESQILGHWCACVHWYYWYYLIICAILCAVTADLVALSCVQGDQACVIALDTDGIPKPPLWTPLARDMASELKSRRRLEHVATAAALGDVETVEEYITAGGDVDGRTLHQHTLLHVAARHGHADVVYILLQANADLDAPDFVRSQCATQ